MDRGRRKRRRVREALTEKSKARTANGNEENVLKRVLGMSKLVSVTLADSLKETVHFQKKNDKLMIMIFKQFLT